MGLRFPTRPPKSGFALASAFTQGVSNALGTYAKMKMQQAQIDVQRQQAAAQQQHWNNMQEIQALHYGDVEMPKAFLGKMLGQSDNETLSSVGKSMVKESAQNVFDNAPSPAHAMVGAAKLATVWGVGPQAATQNTAPQQMPQPQQQEQPQQQSQPEQDIFAGLKPGSHPGTVMVPYGMRSMISSGMAQQGKLASAGIQQQTALQKEQMDINARIAQAKSKEEAEMLLKEKEFAHQKELKEIEGRWGIKREMVRAANQKPKIDPVTVATAKNFLNTIQPASGINFNPPESIANAKQGLAKLVKQNPNLKQQIPEIESVLGVEQGSSKTPNPKPNAGQPTLKSAAMGAKIGEVFSFGGKNYKKLDDSHIDAVE